MDKLLIRGGRRLQGEVVISGAKNAALPEMCAALLTTDPVRLTNVPRLQDVATMRRLLQSMGMDVQTVGERGGMRFHCAGPLEPRAPYELVKTMRASILALGPLLARLGHASVSLPGGCAIGQRPVDQHISGLRAMGAEIEVAHGYIQARLPAGRQRLQGARITTDMITVTGTENLLMAATLIEIKSRMLLPPVKTADDEEPEDPRAALVRRLLEYERIKLAAARLGEVAQRDFITAQIHVEQALAPDFAQVDLADLQQAWRAILRRARLVQSHRITREELSVREHMSLVLKKLQGRRFAPFEELFDLTRGAPVLVVTFIALLELAKEALVEITQAEAYAPIYVRLAFTPA